MNKNTFFTCKTRTKYLEKLKCYKIVVYELCNKFIDTLKYRRHLKCYHKIHLFFGTPWRSTEKWTNSRTYKFEILFLIANIYYTFGFWLSELIYIFSDKRYIHWLNMNTDCRSNLNIFFLYLTFTPKQAWGGGHLAPPLEKAIQNRYRFEMHVHSPIFQGQLKE